MIDFSTLKSLEIPEGNVTQIADASGNVLWSAVENVTINLSFTRGAGYSFWEYASVTIGGVVYPLDEINPQSEELNVPIGTVITCKVASSNTSVGNPTIKLNKNTVANGNTEYLYTVVGGANIVVATSMGYSPMTGTVPYGTITITEL